MDGAHSIARCEEVLALVLKTVFATLSRFRVSAETMLLKTAMVLPGIDCPQQASPLEIANATIRCLRGAVPPSVPGVLFLSGGQESIAATERLNAICRSGAFPWTLSFSFGRALQNKALETWGGSAANTKAAQDALRHRAVCNGLALRGQSLCKGRERPLKR